MKRICALVLALLLAFMTCPAQAEEIPHVEALSNPDTFYEDHLAGATPADQSERFRVLYRVLDGSAQPVQTSEAVRGVTFELLLENLSDEALKNVHLTMHYNERLQLLLGMPSWETSSVTLKAKNGADQSNCAIYAWSTFVQAGFLHETGDLTLRDFYDTILEITWKGGSEILHLTLETVQSTGDDGFDPIPDGCTLLSQDAIDQINKAGEDVRVTVYSGPDSFLTKHLEDALPVDESETFAVNLRIVDLSAENDAAHAPELYWPLRFELELRNKTGKALDDVCITAHWTEKLQSALANPVWQIAPLSLAANKKDSDSRLCGLETYLVEENLSAAEPLTADDFYTIMLDVTWKDGREILYVTPDSQALAAPDEHFSSLPDGCTVLDADAIARINEAAK